MTTLIRTGYVVEAYANWSRWVARCGLCPWAKTLQRFEPHIECPLCSTVTEIIWPADDMVAGVERLLMMRPDPSTRNWSPGETLIDLMWENGLHGILDNAPADAKFTVEENRIRHDTLILPKPRVRRELT